MKMFDMELIPSFYELLREDEILQVPPTPPHDFTLQGKQGVHSFSWDRGEKNSSPP